MYIQQFWHQKCELLGSQVENKGGLLLYMRVISVIHIHVVN